MGADENQAFVYEFGKFVLDPAQKSLTSDGIPLHLPAKEFDTLLLLVENNGRALSKEEMMSAIWPDANVEEGNLAKHISRLRKILNSNGEQYIETLPKHGYRFSADIRRTIIELDEPVIFEKRTVKRVTFSVENEIGPEQKALPPSKPNYLRFAPPALLLLVAMVGLGYLVWLYRQDIFSTPVDPYEPVRLTDNPNDDTGPRWTRDGRIRFHRIHPDKRHETLIMNADGSGQTELNTADGIRIFSWSPDEQRILYQKRGDMTKTYLANADGRGEILLPFMGGNWSADSKMLTYHSKVLESNYDIFVYSVETGETRNVTNLESFEADPSFSPDGTHVVFSSGRDGNAEIYSLALADGKQTRLTFDPGVDSHPAYSPDGTVILFNSDRENENGDVYIMRSDGSGSPVKITTWDKSNETAGPGGWSPDGTKIAFFSDRNGKDDIYVMSAENVRPKLVFAAHDRDIGQFSSSPDGKKIVFSQGTPDKSGELSLLDRETGRTTFLRKTDLPNVPSAWSPHGNNIAFHDRIEGNSEICLINSDGTGFRNLTNDPSRDVSPSWSPDGNQIVFVTYRGEGTLTSRLYTMNRDGNDPRAVTPVKGFVADPVWSPDGALIFLSCDRADVPGNAMDVCQIGPDGSTEKRVLSHRDYDAQPAVSPDGQRIAFTTMSDGNAEIYLMNSDGSGLLRLTRHPADDQWPKWSPDGKKLMFTSNRGGSFAIYEVDLN